MLSNLRPVLRAARDTGMSAVELVWANAFALTGGRQQSRFQVWNTTGKQRVLVIAPHPDDETVGCAGVIARHLQAGDTVGVACITDGRRSRALGLGPDAMAETRRLEASSAMRVLQVTEWEWFGLREGEWDLEVNAVRLKQLVTRISPDVIYAPSRVDFHPEHIQVALLVAQTIAPNQCMRVYPVQVPLTPILANCIAPVSACVTPIRDALNTYASQRASVRRSLRLRHYAARQYGMSGLVEEFWQMPGAVYSRLHKTTDANSPNPFYGLRYYPFTDPLAYTRGIKARRELAEQAHIEL